MISFVLKLPILRNYMHEGVEVEAGQGGGCGVVDHEDGDGLMVVDLCGDVSLTEKEQMKSTNGCRAVLLEPQVCQCSRRREQLATRIRKEQPTMGRREKEGTSTSCSLRWF
ncbi:hypothetical protein GW17_00028290 [Ensete ventricosum]|nr:hypothetical protein GW17_00028290 [Ensete ventricosum]